MTEINLYDRITFIGGFRNEQTSNNYHSTFGSPRVDEDGNVINITGLVDTVGSRKYSQLLPMFHLKFDLFKWANLRLAVTESLSRPNFFSLVPWERINEGENIAERGEPNLKQMTSWNYDAILSLFGKFGLLTFDGFLKSVDNIDYTLTSRIFDPTSPLYGLSLTRPVNAENTSTIKGFEIDLQSNFRFLPSPFNGIVISVNYTHLNSVTYYPVSLIEQQDVFPYKTTVIDTVRKGRMPGQVDDLLNLTLGYEKRGFSARISMVYQGESLFVEKDAEIGALARSVGVRAELDSYNQASTRWDLSIKQNINRNFQIFLNVNNLTNAMDVAYLAGSSNHLITSMFAYGMTADLGLTYKF